jgi:hypothetical protein
MCRLVALLTRCAGLGLCLLMSGRFEKIKSFGTGLMLRTCGRIRIVWDPVDIWLLDEISPLLIPSARRNGCRLNMLPFETSNMAA